jgi:hypothetical protein
MTLTFNNCSFGSTSYDGSMKLELKGGTFGGTSNNYDVLIAYNALDMSDSFYLDGTMRVKSGTEAGNWPTGHSVGNVGGGQAAELQVSLGDSKKLSLKDNSTGKTVEMENLNLFLLDSNASDNEFQTTNTPYYFAYHGSGATDSSNTARICTSDLGGCIVISHSGTSAFEFTSGNDNPTDGTLEILGDSSSKILMDAGKGNDDQVEITVWDTSGTKVVGPKLYQWSNVTSSSFSSNLN